MKEDTVKPFKLAENRYAFYDVFIHRTGNVVAIAPMYESWLKELGVSWENIQCHVSGTLFETHVNRDPHKHTIVITFVPPQSMKALGGSCEALHGHTKILCRVYHDSKLRTIRPNVDEVPHVHRNRTLLFLRQQLRRHRTTQEKFRRISGYIHSLAIPMRHSPQLGAFRSNVLPNPCVIQR